MKPPVLVAVVLVSASALVGLAACDASLTPGCLSGPCLAGTGGSTGASDGPVFAAVATGTGGSAGGAAGSCSTGGTGGEAGHGGHGHLDGGASRDGSCGTGGAGGTDAH